MAKRCTSRLIFQLTARAWRTSLRCRNRDSKKAPFEVLTNSVEDNSEFINPDPENRLAWFHGDAALPKPDEVVLALLKESGESLTLVEIAEKAGLPEKKVFKALRKLFEAELIDTKNHRYMIRKA
jgi:hypothetical protein